MGLHDTATVAGVSEACRYNDHSMCRAPGCGCTCHTHASIEPPPAGLETGPENACPTCGSKRPATESYCRVDGSRLTSLACGMCGRGMNPEDKFCFNCGAPKGSIGRVNVPQVIVAPEAVGDYEQQVLRGLQEELNGPTQEVKPEAQRIVEQPAGAGGSFKLVSSPNPNKIRTPTKQPVRPSIRLPIKPA